MNELEQDFSGISNNKNFFQLFLILSGGIFIGFFIFFLINYFVNNYPSRKQSNYQSSARITQPVVSYTNEAITIQPIKYSPTPRLSEKEREIEKRTESFLTEDINLDNNNLAHFPEFKEKFPKEKIKDAFNIKLKEATNTSKYIPQSGWIIEVETMSEYNSVFLLSKTQQIELINAMSSNSKDANDFCDLRNVQTVGTQFYGPVLNLQDKNGYVILYSECRGYGGGESVSVYGLTDGKKIKLTGDFLQRRNQLPAVTKSGNAMGRLRGIYGIEKPTMIVEVGGFESAGSDLEYLSSIAFFDMQTGSLKQLIPFQ
ncbi:hypothetical protein HY345_03370 [Candidatus Microgenomates bacterium]|nr:hypothetical protein [Candidatus Microgenomates bacterium]